MERWRDGERREGGGRVMEGRRHEGAEELRDGGTEKVGNGEREREGEGE